MVALALVSYFVYNLATDPKTLLDFMDLSKQSLTDTLEWVSLL
jgi:hypothetical protein